MITQHGGDSRFEILIGANKSSLSDVESSMLLWREETLWSLGKQSFVCSAELCTLFWAVSDGVDRSCATIVVRSNADDLPLSYPSVSMCYSLKTTYWSPFIQLLLRVACFNCTVATVSVHKTLCFWWDWLNLKWSWLLISFLSGRL